MSRRDQIIMSKEEIVSFLKAAKTIILVSNGKDGFSHPMPMWFCVDDDGTICMTTFTKSQKVKNLERDPRTSLLVESGIAYEDLKGVVIQSRAEIIRDENTTAEVMFRVALQRGDAQPEQKELIYPELERRAKKRITMRFSPDKIMSWDHSRLGGTY